MPQLRQNMKVVPFHPNPGILPFVKPEYPDEWQVQAFSTGRKRPHGSGLSAAVFCPDSDKITGTKNNIDFLYGIRNCCEISLQEGPEFLKICDIDLRCCCTVPYDI